MPAKTATPREEARKVMEPVPDSVKIGFEPPAAFSGKEGRKRRIDLAEDVRQMIDSDESSKGLLEDEYKDVDELYLGRDKDAFDPPWEDAPSFNLQTLRNKLDSVQAFTCIPFAEADPFFIFRPVSSKTGRSESVETIVHYFLLDAEWGLKLTEATNLITRRGKSPVRIEYRPSENAEGKDPGIEIEALDVRYVRIYPNSADCIEKARLFGDVIQVPVSWVHAKQDSGAFFGDNRVGPNAEAVQSMANPERDKQASGTNAVYATDEAVDLFQGFVRLDPDESGEARWFEIVTAIDESTLLYLEEKQTKADRYVDLFFQRETGRYYNESFLGQLLKGTHHWVNFISDMFGWMTEYQVMRPTFVEGFDMGDDVLETRPGQVIGTEMGGRAFSLGGDANLTPFPYQIELAKRTSDETSRISQNGLGGNLKAGTTATEAAQVAQGQATGIRALIVLGLVYGMVKVAQSIQKILYENFEDWYPVFQQDFPDVTKEDFGKRYSIQVNGQTPIDTPAAITQQVNQLMTTWIAALQAQPDLAMRFPDVLIELLRSAIEATTLPTKDKITPTREEQEQRDALIQKYHQLQAMLQEAQNGGGLTGTGGEAGGSGAIGEPDMAASAPDVGTGGAIA